MVWCSRSARDQETLGQRCGSAGAPERNRMGREIPIPPRSGSSKYDYSALLGDCGSSPALSPSASQYATMGVGQTQFNEALYHVLPSPDSSSKYDRWTSSSDKLPEALHH